MVRDIILAYTYTIISICVLQVKNDFVTKNRSMSDLKAHLVLTSKYRKKVFSGEMLTRMHDIFLALLAQWDCKLIEFNGEEDHIHLLFQYHPDIALNKLVNNLKSVSSRKLRQEFQSRVNEGCSMDWLILCCFLRRRYNFCLKKIY
jgi:putative transposase